MKVFHGSTIRNSVNFDEFVRLMKTMESYPMQQKFEKYELKEKFMNFMLEGLLFAFYTSDGKCVGMIGMEHYDGEKGNDLCVAVAATNRQFRNQGICTKLLQYATQYCCNKGYTRIYIKDDLENPILLNIAKKNGFIVDFDAIATAEYTRVDGEKCKRVWRLMYKDCG